MSFDSTYTFTPRGGKRRYYARQVQLGPADPEYKAGFWVRQEWATLFQDVETGLLVADVPAYERWLERD